MGLKKGVIYVFIASLINLMMSLFTGFFLPKYLSIDTFADIKLYQLYIAYIGLLHFGFSDGMYLKYGGKNFEQLNKKSIIDEYFTFLYFQIFITLIFVLLGIYLNNFLIIYFSLSIVPINAANYIRNLYQATGQFKRYSRFTNMNTFLIFLINIILLFVIKSDNSSLFIVNYIIIYFVFWILISIELIKWINAFSFKFNIGYIVQNIKNGFFLMIGNFCNVIFTSVDRIFVQKIFGIIKFAFYSFAVSIENLLNVFITPVSTVLYNYFCNHKEKNEVIYIKKMLLIFSSFLLLAFFPVKFIVNQWLDKYNDSLNVLLLLFGAQYCSIIVRTVHINIYKALKKQNIYFVIMLLIIFISFVLNLFFVFINGTMELIALATLFTNLVWFIIGEFNLKNFRLDFKDYFYYVICLIFFVGCSFFLSAIYGFFMYLLFLIVLTFIIMRKQLIIIFDEFKKILNRKNKLDNL